jgi:hypothetical protein
MSKRKDKPDPEQSRRFIKKARELGLDVTEAEFDEQLRRIAKAPPPKRKPEKKHDKPG